jgi:hypothetical protein
MAGRGRKPNMLSYRCLKGNQYKSYYPPSGSSTNHTTHLAIAHQRPGPIQIIDVYNPADVPDAPESERGAGTSRVHGGITGNGRSSTCPCVRRPQHCK